MKQLLETVSWRPLLEALVTCCSLISTLLVSRANRWLRAHLEREKLANEKQIADMHERELLRSNATLRVLTETSASAERVTLESLLSNEQADFTLESSDAPSVPAPRAATRPGLGPLKPTSRASGSRRATDWSDDEDVTMQAPPSTYPPPWPSGSKP